MSDFSDSGLVEFTFGEGDDAVINKSNTYKGVTGQCDRVSFVWWRETDKEGLPIFESKPRFVSAQRHYFEQGPGYVLHGGPEFTSISGKNPKKAAATILIVWPTEDDGTPDKAAMMKKWKVKPIVLDGKKTEFLKRLYALHPWDTNDVLISCEDSKYQKLSFTPAPQGMFGHFVQVARSTPDPEDKDAVAKQKKAKDFVLKVMEKVSEVEQEIAEVFGKKMSVEDLRRALTGGDASGATSAPSAETEEKMQNLVEGLL